jgi:hypothetical protein
MPLDAIMQALLEPLEAIPGIGHVYPYERVALDPTAINGTIGPLQTLRYWCLSRASTTEQWRGNASVERVHRLRLRGYMAIDDTHASERVYQDLLDQVLETLSAIVDVPGSAEYLSAPWLERQEARLLAETIPVHFSETMVLVSEYVLLEPVPQPAGLLDDYRALADWLVSQIGTLPNIGQVHPYERLVVTPEQATSVFGPASALRAWTVTRESAPGERLPGLEDRGQDRVMLRGYLTVDDPQASELVMQDLLEQIAMLLRPSHTVGLLDRVGPLQIEEVGHSMLGQTHLVHLAQCSLPVETFALANTP